MALVSIFAGCFDASDFKAPIDISDPRPTVDHVRIITAELMGVDRAKVTPTTSLGDLGADELDCIELVMELEDRFNISISDENIEGLMGTDDWKAGMPKVTMEKLASIVDQKRKPSPVGTTP